MANLPPVSMTPVANFATSSPCVVDTGGNLPPVSTEIIGTISVCRYLKVNLKAKIYIYVNSTTQRWCTLVREYLREFSKKFEMAVVVYSDAWGKLINEKNQKSKIS